MALFAVLLLAALGGLLPARAGAEGLEDDGGAEWRLEQPLPPPPPSGVEGGKVPVGLGRIGDLEFWAPNRGALITAGNGSTVPPGVWAYNGEGWHELATVCGASDRGSKNPHHVGRGRIAWAGPDEFWTISDGRPGQAAESLGRQPELEDNTLCRFAIGPSGSLEVVDSYASLAFQSTSYQAMDAAACIESSDCWFAGEVLPEPEIGAFQLHWDGHTLTREPYLPEGHAVTDMSRFEGRLYQSVRLKTGDQILDKQGGAGEEPALHVVNPEGVSPNLEAVLGIPLLGANEFPLALDFLPDPCRCWHVNHARRQNSVKSGEKSHSQAGANVSNVVRQIAKHGHHADQRADHAKGGRMASHGFQNVTWAAVTLVAGVCRRVHHAAHFVRTVFAQNHVKSIFDYGIFDASSGKAGFEVAEPGIFDHA